MREALVTSAGASEATAACGWSGPMDGAACAAPAAHLSLTASYLYCRRVTSEANSSFPIAFRLLPSAKRRAMEALYAFLRLSDDLADEPGELEAKRMQLRAWRAGLTAAIAGRPSHPIHPALVSVIGDYNLPPWLLFAALDGVETDLAPIAFGTFADLYPYCFRVASAVGLSCIRIWGFRAGLSSNEVATAEAAAEAAGIAFQLTNILRDVREDYERGRVYIPADELSRFGVSPEHWRLGRLGEEYRALMELQISRAWEYYIRSRPLEGLLSNDGRAIFHVMSGSYQRLLREIEMDVEGAYHQRARVPNWKKGLLLMSGWASKMGLL